jgi:drug/metabolite transporter (DMT)-like permease
MITALLYAVTVLVWGTTWFAIKFQLGIVSPEVSVFYRFVIGGAVMLAWALIKGDSFRFSWRDHGYLAAMGATLFSFNFVVFYYATEGLTTGLVAVIMSTAVAWNVFNARFILGRTIEHVVLLGALFGVSGIAVVFWPAVQGLHFGDLTFRSLGLALLGALFFSVGSTLSQRNHTSRLPLIASTAVAMGYGALLLLLWIVGQGQPFAFDGSAGYLLSLAYLSLFGTVIGFACYLAVVGRLGAARASYATVLFPLVALGISTFLEDYRWSLSAIVGVALVLCGNVIVLGGARWQRRAMAAAKPEGTPS